MKKVSQFAIHREQPTTKKTIKNICHCSLLLTSPHSSIQIFFFLLFGIVTLRQILSSIPFIPKTAKRLKEGGEKIFCENYLKTILLPKLAKWNTEIICRNAFLSFSFSFWFPRVLKEVYFCDEMEKGCDSHIIKPHDNRMFWNSNWNSLICTHTQLILTVNEINYNINDSSTWKLCGFCHFVSLFHCCA